MILECLKLFYTFFKIGILGFGGGYTMLSMIMTESTDGFYISEQDLKIRGAGEMFGLRQSGELGLLLADIYEDMDILKCARLEAKNLINSKEKEDINLCSNISKSIERYSRYICFN